MRKFFSGEKKPFIWPAIAGVLLILFIILHEILIYKSFVVDFEGNFRTTGAGFGDIPFHLTQVSKFAFHSFSFDNPIFTGTQLNYSFAVNLLSGWLLRLTGSWSGSFNLPVMVFAASSAILVFFIYRRLLSSAISALFALVLFYFGGGWGAYGVFYEQVIGNHLGFLEFFKFLITKNISPLLKWGAVYPEQNIVWGAPLALVFLHQRSFIMGFFVFALVLWLWARDPDFKNKKTVFGAAILIGLSPLIHIYTFIILLGFLSVLCACKLFLKESVVFRNVLAVFGVSVLAALPQLYYLFSNMREGGKFFLAFRFGWMAQPTIGSVVYPVSGGWAQDFFAYLKFLWMNLGLLLPFFIISGIFLYYAGRKPFVRGKFAGKYREFVFWWLTAFAIFVLLQTVRLQPWDFDNNKLIVYFAFFCAPVIVAMFGYFYDKYKLPAGIFFGVYFFLSTVTGVLDVLPRLFVPMQNLPIIFTAEDRALAEFIRASVPEEAFILTSQTMLNPVVSLAGRPVLAGYGGWLWTEGIPSWEREEEIKRFYSDPQANNYMLKKYGIGFVLLDSQAVNEWHASRQQFDALYTKIFSTERSVLYKIDK
ncbi:hypothetical protein A2662_00605 [Candidatus Giovannonibacteria bacterium RIFCSPHIGHO2_01_FULL_45_33]|uniref:Glycosyltransferase RgtA/B/C/D-like domain-containing protein n=1 Tax=Candidatus Giovannonibacteria bacterium RIFCSPLOWO2_01_FULL_45_34 TaxID=1798351 RepID=A0A1F5WYW1_9BACT|nr:MAG: hypothetical protein A2662_00605 [Candidatus Giovannonibacteria bacterium RIFCSPHIGHO2_01_FULL_45_33]OGF69281.1 MAG: hypothetical protein A3C73_01560 [Candidatus Giovannonibacteria bacterium RIFCSPHIGHO2_02_FULL_44_11]OGF80828.1 MAG: hypothetical protein A2930_00425 [Candidatus Giovannonibacteria bacterium RIFCSPLOWO2_01_FULL_45_34]